MENNGVIVKVIDQTVIIEKSSSLRLSYSLSQDVRITVNEGIADKICGACGTFTGSITIESIMLYMDQYRAPDFPTWWVYLQNKMVKTKNMNLNIDLFPYLKLNFILKYYVQTLFRSSAIFFS